MVRTHSLNEIRGKPAIRGAGSVHAFTERSGERLLSGKLGKGNYQKDKDCNQTGAMEKR